MTKLPSGTRSLRIFIVEDHRVVREALTNFLESLGYTVLSANGMIEALQLLPAAACEVLICDLKLPDGNGWELLKQVNLSEPIFAIAMSGFYSEADRELSKAAGYRHYLNKPFHPGEILTILETAASEISASGPVVPSLAHTALKRV